MLILIPGALHTAISNILKTISRSTFKHFAYVPRMYVNYFHMHVRTYAHTHTHTLADTCTPTK